MIKKYDSIILNKPFQCFLLVALFFIIIAGNSCYYNDDSRKVKYPKTSKVAEAEIRKICAELVLPDDFKKTRDENAFIFHDRAIISNQFSADLGFTKVKAFYIDRLSKGGWLYKEQFRLDGNTTYLRFEREAYEINIERRFNPFLDKNEYFISCSW